MDVKVFCKINLSKGGKYKEEEKIIGMKSFTCEICSKSLSSKGNLKRHINEKHFGKQRVAKDNEKMDVRDENKYIESVLNRVKIDFERKRELGKIAMEMIEKYELNVNRMPKEVKNAIIFNLKMEGMD